MADSSFPVLLLSDDLMFTSRVSGTARSLGQQVRPARSAEALRQLARQQPPPCVILDLANDTLDVADLVGWLKKQCQPPPFVVAYGSHVDTATLRAAREAGCDLVLPRSRFVEELPKSLGDWLAAKPMSSEAVSFMDGRSGEDVTGNSDRPGTGHQAPR
jgi:CheY-like chemotaxis protein